MIIEPPVKLPCLNCLGTIHRLELNIQGGKVSAQYKCNMCREYIKYENGDWSYIGKLNG